MTCLTQTETDMNMENVRVLTENELFNAVKALFIEANYRLPEEVEKCILEAEKNETSEIASGVLSVIAENVETAKKLSCPICQDTGMAVLFLETGRNVYIDCDLEKTVNKAVAAAYDEGYLRKSMVRDPLYDRTNTDDNTPALIHVSFSSDAELTGKVKLTAAPKGFGSENMSSVKMLLPTATENDVVEFVIETVKKAGANPCPPIFVGVGIGSDFEGCALLSKKALLRDAPSENENYRKLEEKLLSEINKTDIGPQGFGGDTTALGVRVEAAPTHIAGMPCAVNINCHVSRHVTKII